MRFIEKQLSLWRIVLIISVAAIAIPIAARVSPTAIAVVNQRHEYQSQPTANTNEDADVKHSKDSKAAVGKGVAWLQDDYYDRRREYWDKRIERRLDREDLDDETGDEKGEADAKDSKDKKDSKADKDDGDDEDDSVDQEVERIERRREYWRQRVERDW